MQLVVQQTLSLNGAVSLPSSKSESIRALMIALLSCGKSTIKNFLSADDTRDALQVCQQFGASYRHLEDSLEIISAGVPLQETIHQINSGNSGLATHFIMPVIGLRKNPDTRIILDCGAQMRKRPIYPLINALTELGLTINSLNEPNALPIAITGKLRGGICEVEGITSQYLSALLLALPLADNDSVISVRHLKERPYVEMTCRWLTHQNIYYTHQSNQDTDIFHIQGGQHYHKFSANIPGDFSSAANMIAAAVMLEGTVELHGIDMSDTQGDKRIVNILSEMGADIQIKPNQLLIKGGIPLRGMTIDAGDIPDLLPILAVIGTQASGKTMIRNVAHARIKETDRIHSMSTGLKALGAKLEEQADGLTIHQSKLAGTPVKGFNDHRTVMALSIAGLLATGTTLIDDGSAIDKTFPTYATLMQSLGANLEKYHDSVS